MQSAMWASVQQEAFLAATATGQIAELSVTGRVAEGARVVLIGLATVLLP